MLSLHPITRLLCALVAALTLSAVTQAQDVAHLLEAADSPELTASGDAIFLSDYEVSPSAASSAAGNEGEIVLTNACTTGMCSGCQQCGGTWRWQALPRGLIYRSYLAGPREPRIGTQFISTDNDFGNQFLWDATVGGRRGLIRYGDCDPMNPCGWQLDIEGAAIVRLNIDEERDVDASDFRFGVPLTYGAGNWQFKTGYYHLSSHLGDEFIVRNLGATRINYVRDCIMFGLSVNPNPDLRVYGEIDFAVFTSGGADTTELQFGLEYARAGVTGFRGTPFFATNAHLREELDFSGDWTTQLGWLWRNIEGNTMRVGLHYVNGKSTQYQFFRQNEEQIGAGIWYDF